MIYINSRLQHRQGSLDFGSRRRRPAFAFAFQCHPFGDPLHAFCYADLLNQLLKSCLHAYGSSFESLWPKCFPAERVVPKGQLPRLDQVAFKEFLWGNSPTAVAMEFEPEQLGSMRLVYEGECKVHRLALRHILALRVIMF